MSEGRWRDARRMKAQKQKLWEQIYQEDEEEDDGKEKRKK